MDEKLVNLILGTLLHDVGKIVHRTGEMRTHSILGREYLSEIPVFKNNKDINECIAFHHGRELRNSDIATDSLAYITYIADNISAAGDRREELIEGLDDSNIGRPFNKQAPLSSVFNNINGNKQKYSYSFKMIKDINYPTDEIIEFTEGNYNEVKHKINTELKGIKISKEYINSVLHLLETTTTIIPSSTKTNELGDISLYDHSKTAAAIASCIYYYLDTKDYKARLLDKESDFKENAFILLSCDISGIQNYIYTISGKNGLKSLRARSLYLELLLENIVDELLANLGLSRCNLIYTGGGHAYLLLPNNQKVKSYIEEFDRILKEWFIETFDISLFIAFGYTECSANELASSIGSVYERVGKNIAIKKTSRYTSQEIIKLNNFAANDERECRECKTSDNVNEMGICDVCQSLIDISSLIIRQGMYFTVESTSSISIEKIALPLPFGQILTIKNIDEVRKMDPKPLRIYSKNNPSIGENFVTNLWVGDYSALTTDVGGSRVKTFNEFADDSVGINRIAVLRADVDNLGKAFISGFNQGNYESISRTVTLSRHLSMFFKFYINEILNSKKRNALIVYSGGDDMFIVGSWNEVIDLSKDMREAFIKYTQGTLTISAGIGIFPQNYPIYNIASYTGELEAAAKMKDDDKNKVTLFRKAKKDEKNTIIEEDWILSWEELPFIEKKEMDSIGIEEKLNELRRVLNNDEQKGKAFLYKILDLLRDSKDDKVNIARYAYLLKRAQEKNNKLNVTTFYKWIKNDKERKELEIAITLYSYETRNNKGGK